MRSSVLLATLLVVALSTVGRSEKQPPPDYNTKVAPVLKKYCAGCHNEDDREGKFSVETFAELQRGGEHGPAFFPRDSKSSRLVRLMTGQAKPKMPPDGSEMPTPAEIKLLIAWIDAGAKGPDGAEPVRGQLITPSIAAAKTGRPITSLDWAGDTIAAARFAEVELLDAASRRVVRRLGGFPGKVNAVRFSADGKRLAIASGLTGVSGEATIANAADGKVLTRIAGHRDTLYAAVLSPDATLLATASYDRRIMLWDVASGAAVRTMTGHNGAVYDLAFSPDGTVLASASADETVKLWQVATGQRLDTLGQPQDEQYVVRFSPDGRFVIAGGADNRIRVWRFVSKQQQRINPLVYARFAHEGPIVNLAFADGGKTLVSVAEDRSVKLWETASFTQSKLYETQPDVVAALAVAPGGRSFLVGRMDGSLQDYAVESGDANGNDSPADVVRVTTADAAAVGKAVESEPNDSPAAANVLNLPVAVAGTIAAKTGHDEDLYRFRSQAGEQWVMEVNAARSKSPLDSRIEVLDADGNPIPRVLLEAVRDSYFTFRGKDSSTSGDFRVHNWEEMELNELLYANGEVVKLWHYPRGPDSGFLVYPGRGNRYTYFDTTPTSHALQSPCYIVRAHPPGTKLIPSGLPTFPLYYENDDDGLRRWGSDSRLTFTAPAEGEYLVRVSDVRGFQGDRFKYTLTVRPPRPDFKVTLSGANPTVNAGSGKEFKLVAERHDGFEGEIRVNIDGLPPGFEATSPLTIQAEQNEAYGLIRAAADAKKPAADVAKATVVKAVATIGGNEVIRDVNNLGEIKLGARPKLGVAILPAGEGPAEPVSELTIAPGQTIQARVRVDRHGFGNRVSFGKEDAGRNLPHGVFVDNIGLNGLLIVEGQTERTFFITAAKWVPEMSRVFHLRTTDDGTQTSHPVMLHVRRSAPSDAAD